MQQESAGTVLRYIRQMVRADGLHDEADGILLERFAASGDKDAFALMVRRHGPMVLGVCRRVLSHDQDAEDAFQATFMVLARKAGGIQQRQLLANWLYGVAIRIAAKARASGMKRRTRETLLPDFPELEAQAESAWWSIREVLDEEVSRLPAKYRLPFMLCYLQGLTNEEAAAELKCPKGTLQSRLSWARDRLRSRLTRRGVALSGSLLAALLARNAAPAAVPARLADSIVSAALAFGGWKTTAGGTMSVPAVHLAQGVLHAMFITKMKFLAIILLAWVLMGAGAGLWLRQSPAAEAPAVVLLAEDEPAKPDEPKAKPTEKHFKAEAVVTKSFQTGAAPRIDVGMFNGSITVDASGDRKVNVKVTKRSDAHSQEDADRELANIDVTIAQDGEAIQVDAKRKDEKASHINSSAWAELQVPAGAVLVLHTSNGSVTITKGTGAANVKTSNGSVTLEGRKGTAQVSSSNGPIVVNGGTGKLELKTSNGRIEIKAEKAAVTAHTSNGGVKFEGTLSEGSHTLHSSNGNLSVALLGTAGVRVEAETTNGVITAGSNIVKAKEAGRVHLGTTLGENPTSTLKIHTSNGNIAISREKE